MAICGRPPYIPIPYRRNSVINAKKTTASSRARPEQILLGERIANAREARGLSHKQLAYQMGVKKVTLEHWESGKTAPRANRLNQLAGVLNVPLLWLLGGSDQPPPGMGPDSNETAGIEGRLMRAERLVKELSQLLGDLRAETRQVQQRISDD